MGRFLGIIPMGAIGNVTGSPLFKKMVKKSFAECDKDANGKIDEKELHICLLLLHDKLNAKLPCRLRVPSPEQVHELFERHDKMKSGSLGEEEMLALASELFADDKHWWDSILVKVAVTAAIQLAVFPLAGRTLSFVAKETATPGLQRVAPAVWAYGVEKLYKLTRIVVPALP